jgi:peptidoglycan/LPS O-acetylase OafA/YrhL
MVMLFHMNGSIVHIPGPVTLAQTGVDLFFVLSGFLITSILLRAAQRDWHEVRVFYVRRTLRIFPLYYATLIVVWIGLMHDHVSWDVWVYLQNVTMTFRGLMRGPTHFWSLAVEEQFYLVWPFLVLWLPRRAIGKVLATMFAIALLSRVLLLHYGYGIFYLTPSRIDTLSAGAWLAVVVYRGRLESLRSLMLWLFGGSMVVLVAEQLLGSRHYAEYFIALTKFTVFAIFYVSGIALLLLRQAPRLNQVLSSRALRFVGRISYGLYVFHPFVFFWVEHHMLSYPMPLRVLASFVGTYAVALFSWNIMERHFIGLKDKLAPEPQQFPLAAPPMTAL